MIGFSIAKAYSAILTLLMEVLIMDFEMNTQFNAGDRPAVGLVYRPEDWGGYSPKDSSLEERTESTEEMKKQSEGQSDYKALSMERIVENERIRESIDIYLEDVVRIGSKNLSDEELHDVILYSIIGNTSRWGEVDTDIRSRYREHFRSWKKDKIRLTNYAAGQNQDEFIGKNIHGFIPLCAISCREYWKQTVYYCRDTVTGWLTRIKAGDLKKIAKGESVHELRLDLDLDYKKSGAVVG